MAFALEATRHRLARGHVLHLARHDHGVVIVAMDRSQKPRTFLPHLGAQIASAVSSGAGSAIAGVGDAQADLVDIRTSYLQARHCTRLAEMVPSIGPVVVWSRLGIYRLLAQLPLDQVSADVLPSGLTRLMSSRSGDALVATLETYLDRAGDAAATAAALSIHRVSLYGRLKRIEDIAEVDLRNGEERLWLHLGIKLARMAGLLERPLNRAKD